MFVSALIIAKTRKQPKCPLIDEWTKKMWCIYSMEYYSAMKRMEYIKSPTYKQGPFLERVHKSDLFVSPTKLA